MKVYLVMQSELLKFGRPSGSSRVRECFSSREKAEEYIGPIEEKYVKCQLCNSLHENPAADLDHNFEVWKKKLFIKEWTVQ